MRQNSLNLARNRKNVLETSSECCRTFWKLIEGSRKSIKLPPTILEKSGRWQNILEHLQNVIELSGKQQKVLENRSKCFRILQKHLEHSRNYSRCLWNRLECSRTFSSPTTFTSHSCCWVYIGAHLQCETQFTIRQQAANNK